MGLLMNPAGTKRLMATYVSEDVYQAMVAIRKGEGVPMTVQIDKALRAWLAERPTPSSSA